MWFQKLDTKESLCLLAFVYLWFDFLLFCGLASAMKDKKIVAQFSKAEMMKHFFNRSQWGN